MNYTSNMVCLATEESHGMCLCKQKRDNMLVSMMEYGAKKQNNSMTIGDVVTHVKKKFQNFDDLPINIRLEYIQYVFSPESYGRYINEEETDLCYETNIYLSPEAYRHLLDHEALENAKRSSSISIIIAILALVFTAMSFYIN